MENIDKILKDYDSSGLSGKAFCERKGLKIHRLYYYLKKRMEKQQSSNPGTDPSSSFIELNPVNTEVPSQIVIHTASGHKIIIPMV
jgi:hypothetical protein